MITYPHIIFAYHSMIRYGATELCIHLLRARVPYYRSVLQKCGSLFVLTAVMSAHVQLATASYIFIHENLVSKRKKKFKALMGFKT